MTINFINPTFSLLNSIQSVSTGQSNSVASSANSATAFSDVLDAVISNSNLQSTSENQGASMDLENGKVNLDEIFQKASDTYNIPVQFLKAVAKAESNFDPNAESSAGAQGIMQLMPGTAQGLGVTDSFDPEQNIMGGAKYLSQQLARYDGNEILALAAYNAGPGNVAKYNGVPPFEETQNYIKKVMAYAGEPITAGDAILASPATAISGANDIKDYQTLMSLYRLNMQLNILMSSDSDSDSDSSFDGLLGSSL